jgi:hypothetical protein
MIINLDVVSIVIFVFCINFFSLSSSIIHFVQFIISYACFCCIQSEDLLVFLSTFISTFFTEQFDSEITRSTPEIYAEVFRFEYRQQHQISHGLPQAYQARIWDICFTVNALFFAITIFFFPTCPKWSHFPLPSPLNYNHFEAL